MADHSTRPGRLAMPRTRGAATGILILIIGVWGALIPFIGHYLHLVVGPDRAWAWTTGRLWASLLPGVVAIIGGLMLLRSGNRASASLGAQLALAAGIWFVIVRPLSLLWTTVALGGAPLGGHTRQALALLLYYFGIGALITALAGIALGRVSARHAGDDARLLPAEERAPAGRPAAREDLGS